MTRDVDEDADLVRRLQLGEAGAFDEAYERYQRRVFDYLSRMTGRRELAEDLAQETWMRFALHARRLADDSRLLPWLLRVAHNLWVSLCRWRVLDGTRLRFLSSSGWAYEGMPAADAATDVVRQIEIALGKLPPHHREPLVLVAVDGLSQVEAAEVLGCRPETLRQRLSRARKLLRRALPRELVEGMPTERTAHARE